MVPLIVQAFWYHDTLTGDFYYRIKQPKIALERNGGFAVINVHTLHPLFPDLALHADLLIAHMCAEPEFGPVLRQRKRDGRGSIFEIADHFLAPHAGIPSNDPWRSSTIRRRLLNHAAAADVLQVSTRALKRRYGGLNGRTRVFENQIEHFAAPRGANPDRVVLGWGGSMGHDHDLAGWKPKLRELLDRHPRLHLAFMCPKTVFLEHFGKFPVSRVSFREPGPLEAYYDFLKTLDIGLAPAEDTPFNRCRSDGKFMEYAAHGVAPVLAEVEPFRIHGAHGREKMLYSSLEEGVAAIEALLDDGKRREMAVAAFNYVSKHRSGEQVQERTHLYREWQGSFESVARDLPDAEGLMASLRLAHAAIDGSALDDAEMRLQDLLEVFPNYPQAQYALLQCWWEQRKYEQIVKQMSQHPQLHPVYRDLSLAILVRALRKLGKQGETAVRNIIMDEVVKLDLIPGASRSDETWKKLARMEPYRDDVMRNLLISKSRSGAMAGVTQLTQVYGMIEDSVQNKEQDEAMVELLQSQI
jgi:hypothetical protein